MSPAALIRLQAELEYRVSIRDETIPITPENALEVPRIVVAQHPSGYVRLVRADLRPPRARILEA